MSTLITKLIKLINRLHGRKSMPLSWTEGKLRMSYTPLDEM